MPDLNFDKNGRAQFPTKYHGSVSISKAKWDEICQEPERYFYRENGEKIATTLINPEYVRHSGSHPGQFLYYKKFDVLRVGGKDIGSRVPYWAVVIDESTKKVCTSYPLPKPKKGKEYTGVESK